MGGDPVPLIKYFGFVGSALVHVKSMPLRPPDSLTCCFVPALASCLQGKAGIPSSLQAI